MSAPARWPEAPDNASSLTDPDAAILAAIDAAVTQAIADFGRTTRLHDGTRSGQVVTWAAEFRRVVAAQAASAECAA